MNEALEKNVVIVRDRSINALLDPLIEHNIQIPELLGAVALLATEKVGEEAARNLLVDFGASFQYGTGAGNARTKRDSCGSQTDSRSSTDESRLLTTDTSQST